MSTLSSSKVSIDEMADAIMESLQDYADLAADEMKDAVKDAAKTVRKEIMANAPRKSGDYAKSWATKKQYETSESISYVVYSRNRCQLVHLSAKKTASHRPGDDDTALPPAVCAAGDLCAGPGSPQHRDGE